jgi:hypothetical protein
MDESFGEAYDRSRRRRPLPPFLFACDCKVLRTDIDDAAVNRL